MDIWNDIIKIRNSARLKINPSDNDIRVGDHASILLHQLNTAGAVKILYDECETFITNNEEYLQK